MLFQSYLIILFMSVYCVKSDLLNLNEGAKCSWNGVGGECVSIYRCLSSFIDIKTKDFAPICSFKNKEPIVCCTDCELVNDTRKMIWNPNLGFITKTGQKARDQCLEYIHKLNFPCKNYRNAVMERVLDVAANCYKIDTSDPDKRFAFLSMAGDVPSTVINASVADDDNPLTDPPNTDVFAAVGGVDAFREEFPHMALLGYGDDLSAADWLCGGSVISDRFILTAAHCISSPGIGTVKFVAVGILKRSDPPEFWQKYNVTRIISHPEYRPPSKYHDIALLETDVPISFENRVRPACLHTEGEAKEAAFATGWGALGHRSQLADVLQAVYIYRFGEDECSKLYPPHRHLKNGYNHTTQMCYGDREILRDTCQGDSGGPLQSLFQDQYGCVHTILGVTSYGRQCGISTGSGIYTRVYYYVPWIESVVWP